MNEAKPGSKETKNVFDYIEYVNRENFGEHRKVALDIAAILDDPNSDIESKHLGYGIESTADKRREIFDLFCAICVKSGVPTPDLEEGLYMAYLGAEDPAKHDGNLEKIKAGTDVLLNSINEIQDEEARHKALIIIDFMRMFPDSLVGYDKKVTLKSMLAMINRLLVDSGNKPVESDYSKIRLPRAMSEQGPIRETKVLIVDDSYAEVVNTRISLAGWQNVSTGYVLHERVHTREPNRRELAMQNLIKAIEEAGADVVLMDQGLDNEFEGSDILLQIQQLGILKDVIFVANTGGTDELLLRAGARSNFNKGGNIASMSRVIQSIV